MNGVLTAGCPECDAPVGPGANFCEACGARLPGEPAHNGIAGGPADGAGPGGDQARPDHGTEGGDSPAHRTGDDFPMVSPVSLECANCGTPVPSDHSDHGISEYCDQCGHLLPGPAGELAEVAAAEVNQLGGGHNGRDRLEQAAPRAAAVTDRGKRHPHNQDAYSLLPVTLPGGGSVLVASVCDGVSASPRADEASEAAARTATETIGAELACGTDPRAAMRTAMEAAAQSVVEIGEPGNAPSCTFVAAIVTSEEAVVSWVGDSRVYWLAADPAGATPSEQLTRDDSWAVAAVEAGLISEQDVANDPRAHAVLAWLGADAEPPDLSHVRTLHPRAPGCLLLCTDGLWGYLPGAGELAAVVAEHGGATLGAVRALTALALEAGGSDNITAALLAWPPVAPAPARTEPEAEPEPEPVAAAPEQLHAPEQPEGPAEPGREVGSGDDEQP